MPLEWRGGQARVMRLSIPTAGVTYQLSPPGGPSKWLRLKNAGGNVIRVYFRASDYTADANYLELDTSGAGAIVSEPIEATDLWFRAVTGASTLELLIIYRRG